MRDPVPAAPGWRGCASTSEPSGRAAIGGDGPELARCSGGPPSHSLRGLFVVGAGDVLQALAGAQRSTTVRRP